MCTYLHKIQQFQVKTPASAKLIPKSFIFVYIEPEEKKKINPITFLNKAGNRSNCSVSKCQVAGRAKAEERHIRLD